MNLCYTIFSKVGDIMKRQEKYPETKWFVFENVNPTNRITGDCYVRAVTRATGKDYKEVLQTFFDISLNSGYSIGSTKCIELTLQHLGYTKQKQPKHRDNTKYTGKEFCEEFNKGVYICNIGGHHITVVIDGKIHDIWDCTEKTVGNYCKVR